MIADRTRRKRRTRRCLDLLLGIVYLGLAACSSTRLVPAPGISPSDLRMEMTGPVIDPALEGSVEVGTTESRRLASGKLEVTIPIRNVSGASLEVLVKVMFLDENGFVIPYDETPRCTLVLPRGPYSYRVTSFKDQATRFRVHIDRGEE